MACGKGRGGGRCAYLAAQGVKVAHQVEKEAYNSGKANTSLELRHGPKGGTAPALYRGVAWGK